MSTNENDILLINRHTVNGQGDPIQVEYTLDETISPSTENCMGRILQSKTCLTGVEFVQITEMSTIHTRSF